MGGSRQQVVSQRAIRLATAFSGIGAIEHSLERMKMDYDIVFASDSNEMVKKSYFANYDVDEHRWYDDVQDIDGSKYKYKIDLLVGGSPCQPFSMVGHRDGMSDMRGTLIYEFIRIIRESRPRVFIFENVPGILTHNKGRTWRRVRTAFKKLGYTIYEDTLNAMDYGLPQHRERLFVVGFREKRDDFRFPDPRPLRRTMVDMLERSPDEKYFLPSKGIKFAKKIKNLRKKYTQINGNIALCQKANQQFNWHGDFVTHPIGSTSGGMSLDMYSEHPPTYKTNISKRGRIRKLTPRECHRLMGFNNGYKIVVPDIHAYRQSGNSIAVNVLMALIRSIGEDWLKK